MKKKFNYMFLLIFLISIIIGGVGCVHTQIRADEQDANFMNEIGTVKPDSNSKVYIYHDDKNNNTIYVGTNIQWNNVSVSITSVPDHK